MLKTYFYALHAVNTVKSRIKALGRDESGATMLEYTLLAGLISIAGIVGILAIQPNIKTIWTSVSTNMATAATNS
jgi:pilus assembly protein Flp/PilA